MPVISEEWAGKLPLKSTAGSTILNLPEKVRQKREALNHKDFLVECRTCILLGRTEVDSALYQALLMQIVKISHEIPSIYPRLKEKFGIEWDRSVIITQFPFVHCKIPLTATKTVHEATHLRQQEEIGVMKWWDRYINEPDFRLSQELEAYLEEANFVREMFSDRNLRYRLIYDMARQLSSRMYGSIISFEEARKLLK